jgi:2,3-bisphosphoglycerate-dependent phosphoglycerate mutase
MAFLVLVRHGESRWNMENKFTGWVDVPLSERGIYEALVTAENLSGLDFDVAFTSKLERAQQTLLEILAKQERTGIFLHTTGKRKQWSKHEAFGKNEIPIYSDDALNERYYGKLQGLDKDGARRKWGGRQVFIWRRSWDVRPPGGESLKDTYERAVPYFRKYILPLIRKGKNVLIVASGNSLRAIMKHLDGIPDEKIPFLELPTAKPVVYKLLHGKLRHDDDHVFKRTLHWHAPQRRAIASKKTTGKTRVVRARKRS